MSSPTSTVSHDRTVLYTAYLVQGWSPMTSAHVRGADIVAVLVDLGGNVKLNDRYKVRLSNCNLICVLTRLHKQKWLFLVA